MPTSSLSDITSITLTTDDLKSLSSGVTYTSVPSTTTTYVSGGYMNCTSAGITLSYEGTNKEQVDKLERHVDDLEKDISFFNDKREEQEKMANDLYDKYRVLIDENAMLRTSFSDLQCEYRHKVACIEDDYRNKIDALTMRCQWLQDQLNGILEKIT